MKGALAALLAVVGLAVGALPAASHAEYPDKPIRLVIPFVPGGAADLLGRYLAKALTADFGQPVVVESRSGAGGLIGIEAGRAAPPDGYTLTLISSSYTVNPALYKLKFDPVHDITPIIQISRGPMLIVTSPAFPATSITELVDYARANPNKVNFASSGQGSVIHLANELFNKRFGIQMTHVPYKGGGNAQTDIMAGQVDVYFASTASAIPNVQAGRMRALGVTTANRIAALPNVPTVAESGLPGYEATMWYGIIGPKDLPPAIVARVNAAINKAIAPPEAREKLEADGAEPAGGSAGAFGKIIATEIALWGQVVRDLGIRPE